MYLLMHELPTPVTHTTHEEVEVEEEEEEEEGEVAIRASSG